MESWVIWVRSRTSHRPKVLQAWQNLQEPVSSLSHGSYLLWGEREEQYSHCWYRAFLFSASFRSKGKSLAVVSCLCPVAWEEQQPPQGVVLYLRLGCSAPGWRSGRRTASAIPTRWCRPWGRGRTITSPLAYLYRAEGLSALFMRTALEKANVPVAGSCLSILLITHMHPPFCASRFLGLFPQSFPAFWSSQHLPR